MVVLPLVPVIAAIFALVYLNANSISEIIGIPKSSIFLTKEESLAIPGLIIISSAEIIEENVCLHSSYFILCCLRI